MTIILIKKVSVWKEIVFTVNAENKIEANKQAKEISADLENENFFDHECFKKLDIRYDEIPDTENLLIPDENHGDSTVKLYCEKNKIIYKNGN